MRLWKVLGSILTVMLMENENAEYIFLIKLINSVLGDNNSEAGSETGASGGGGGEEEGEPAEKGDRSHLVVWQVALPQSPNKMNPNMLF